MKGQIIKAIWQLQVAIRIRAAVWSESQAIVLPVTGLLPMLDAERRFAERRRRASPTSSYRGLYANTPAEPDSSPVPTPGHLILRLRRVSPLAARLSSDTRKSSSQIYRPPDKSLMVVRFRRYLPE